MADRAALPNGTSIGVHVMERERDLLFRVIEGEKEYRIYSNGQIEGFGEGAIVINYFDRLLATAIQKHAHLHNHLAIPCGPGIEQTKKWRPSGARWIGYRLWSRWRVIGYRL